MIEILKRPFDMFRALLVPPDELKPGEPVIFDSDRQCVRKATLSEIYHATPLPHNFKIVNGDIEIPEWWYQLLLIRHRENDADAMRDTIARAVWRYQMCPGTFDQPAGEMGALAKNLCIDEAENVRRAIMGEPQLQDDPQSDDDVVF